MSFLLCCHLEPEVSPLTFKVIIDRYLSLHGK